jgi:glycerol uptake facilitator protein
MTAFIGEIIGTMLLIILGNGAAANVFLKNTKGNNGGWIVVTAGWALGVFIGILCVGTISGAHLNPAVTVGLALVGKFAWYKVPVYIFGQLIGAMLGALIVWLFYKQHFEMVNDANAVLGVFCTIPAIRSITNNLISEIVCTFIFVLGVLYIAIPQVGLESVSAWPVSLLVFGIGISLGGTTGYAINPARDLGPRIIHAVLPIPNKRNSDWGYAFVPVVGPIIGTLVASALYLFLQ